MTDTRPGKAADSPRWCERHQKYGDHHTDRHDLYESTTAAPTGGFVTETRAEALQWCKDRALAYVEQGDLQNAFASFASDVRKHPDTEPLTNTIAHLGMGLLLAGQLDTPKQMRDWIEGFH